MASSSPHPALKQAGWEKVPTCEYVVIGSHDLYCAADYEKLGKQASRALSSLSLEYSGMHEGYDCPVASRVFSAPALDDIGLHEGYDCAVASGLLSRPCSKAQCPFLARPGIRTYAKKLGSWILTGLNRSFMPEVPPQLYTQ